MIENAQATLGGINENSQSSRVPQQAWGHEEKSNGSKNFEQKKKNKKKPMWWCSKQYEENKSKEKEPKPITRGHDRQFSKDIQMTKGQETSTGDP